MNKKQTSTSIASIAAKLLQNKNSSAISKQLAASALAQSKTGKQTGAEIESKASIVLQSDKYSKQTKALAGTVLSQSNKKR
jgi:hypothetical protein